jgi:hypothetical protein
MEAQMSDMSEYAQIRDYRITLVASTQTFQFLFFFKEFFLGSK